MMNEILIAYFSTEEPSKSKQEQKSDTQEGKRDIQPLKTHYKTFTKTSLPHVLTEYGLEDKDHPQKKVTQGCGNSETIILAQGQVNGHNVLVQKKFTCPKKQITVALIYLTVLKQYIYSLENSMK